MKKTTAVSVIALSLALVGGNIAPQIGLGIAPAAAQQKAPAMKPEIGNPLNEASALVKQKKYKEALAKAQEVEKIPGKSPYETFTMNEIIGAAYAGSGDYANAARVYEGSLTSGQLPPNQVAQRTQAVAAYYNQAKNYAKAIEWWQKYNKDAQDPETQLFVAQAYATLKNPKAASDAMAQTIKMAAAKGIAAKEDWLLFQYSLEYEAANTPGIQAVLEQLVQRYPKPKYWQDLLTVMGKSLRSGSTKGTLDVYRLTLAAGIMKDEAEFMEMAQVAIQQGLPAEGKTVVEKGMKAGVLGQGAQKERHQRLLNTALLKVDEDSKTLETRVAEAAAQKAGDGDVQSGESYWSYSRYDKAIELLKRGIGKGVKDKDDAYLRLGLAYIGAGQRPQALEAFKQIAPNTTAAQIGRLWTYLSAPKSPT